MTLLLLPCCCFRKPEPELHDAKHTQQRWPSSLLDTDRQSVNEPLVLSLALYSPDPTVFLWSKSLILFSDTLKITRFITRERQCQSQGTGAMNGPVVLSLALYSPDPTVFLWSKTVILLSDTLKRTRLITREHQCPSQRTRYRERTAGSFTRALLSRSNSFPTVRNSSSFPRPQKEHTFLVWELENNVPITGNKVPCLTERTFVGVTVFCFFCFGQLCSRPSDLQRYPPSPSSSRPFSFSFLSRFPHSRPRSTPSSSLVAVMRRSWN
jgi:hypothetical protein